MSVADPIYDPEEESYLINGTGEPEYALMPVCVLTDTSLCEKSKIVYLTFRALSPNNMGYKNAHSGWCAKKEGLWKDN